MRTRLVGRKALLAIMADYRQREMPTTQSFTWRDYSPRSNSVSGPQHEVHLEDGHISDARSSTALTSCATRARVGGATPSIVR